MIFTRESEESALIMQKQESQAGFSLFELLIAMSVMVILMGLASSLLASAFKMRIRENQRTEALADAQRGLNLMSREIANSGYALTDNGIVASDSGLTSIRIRGNLNASAKETTSNTTSDRDEDVKYFLYTDGGIGMRNASRSWNSRLTWIRTGFERAVDIRHLATQCRSCELLTSFRRAIMP